MSNFTEIDALKAVDDALAQLGDESERNRVLQWAWAKYSTQPARTAEEEKTQETTTRKRKSSRSTKRQAHNPSPTHVRTLNLRPDGQQSFTEFAAEKKPTTNQEKCAVAVYYLSQVLGISSIDFNHVFTCFKQAGWRIPNNESAAKSLDLTAETLRAQRESE
jgi:hypothetical protein